MWRCLASWPLLLLCAIIGLAALKTNGQLSSKRIADSFQQRTPACRRRGGGAYCSAPGPGGYVGPLDTAQQLREALDATSFKNEIIVFAETRMSDAVQTMARIRSGAGYGHVLPVMTEQHQCHRLLHIFAPFVHEQGPLSCGSYAVEDEKGQRYPVEFRYLRTGYGATAWWRKWFTVARAVALGYNVMAVDSDIVILDDWYWRVKQPPLSNFNMMSQAECEICINGGFSYIQNASSQGPVAWMLYEAMHRAVRWSEDTSALTALSSRLAQQPLKVSCADDQILLTDSLWSAVTGGPRFGSMKCMLEGDSEALAKLGHTNEGGLLGANIPGFNSSPTFKFEEFPVSGELAEAACESFREGLDCRRFGPTISLQTAVLQMPHSGGDWPLARGGYPFSRQPGPYTQAYREAFKDLGVLLPPDPEDPATEAQARSTPTERFALLHIDREGRCTGCWLESHWFTTGRLGLWHTHLDVPAVQSIGHVHAGLYLGDFQKQVVLQAAGHYDWRAAARMAGSPSRVFFANYPDTEVLRQGLLEHGEEIPRVVAYAPGAIPDKISKEDFVRAINGLAQVAAALGAVVAWPPAPCTADWVLNPAWVAAAGAKPPIPASIPWHHLNTKYVVLPFGNALEELQCEWTGFASTDCLMNRRLFGLESGRGLLALEFDHLRRRRKAEHVPSGGSAPAAPRSELRQPTPETTLRLSEDASAPTPGRLYETDLEQLLQLNWEVLLQQLHERDSVPIFWLDRLVGAVNELQGTAKQVYDSFRKRCRALQYYNLTEGERNLWLRQ